MKYTKLPLTYRQQAELLKSRGMGGDISDIIKALQNINYYRLSAYWIPYKIKDEDKFIEGTTIYDVLNLYNFDSEMRLIIFKYIMEIEVLIKTKMSYCFSHYYKDPFAYTYRENMIGLTDDEYEKFISEIKSGKSKSNEEFVKHFNNKYKEHEFLPIWMAVEIMSFGNILTMYKGSEKSLSVIISKEFNLKGRKVFLSWLRSLNEVRNVCAHHARLWNRIRGYKIRVPKAIDEWEEFTIDNGRIFIILSVIKFILKEKDIKEEIKELFIKYKIKENMLRIHMGFPKNWEEYGVWKG